MAPSDLPFLSGLLLGIAAALGAAGCHQRSVDAPDAAPSASASSARAAVPGPPPSAAPAQVAAAEAAARPNGAKPTAKNKRTRGSKLQELSILDPASTPREDIVACAGQEEVAIVVPGFRGEDDWKVVSDKGLGPYKMSTRPGCIGPNSFCVEYRWNVLQAKPDAYEVKLSLTDTKVVVGIRIDPRLPCD
jgi:hypothetical protein